jgi:hypothetical protein
MEIASMSSLPQLRAAAQLILVIARMLGKAVKFRHCPATVSAPVAAPVLIKTLESSRVSTRATSFHVNVPYEPLKPNASVQLWEGG